MDRMLSACPSCSGAVATFSKAHPYCSPTCRKKANAKRRRSPAQTAGDKWRALRYEVLKKANGRCQLCGRDSSQVQLHIDHIVPKSINPKLKYELNNLQVICAECNYGKGNTDDTDWRKP